MIRLVFLAILLTGPAFAVSNPVEMLTDPAAEARARDIGHQLRCMVCQNESVEESEADLARDFRRVIRERVSAGQSDQQVMDWMVARYGDFIRLRPPFSALTVLLWGAPVVAVGVGAGAVWLGRRRRPVPPAPLTEAERQRLAKLSTP
jgi:cytochrome c-type biogenesis protein CcmH